MTRAPIRTALIVAVDRNNAIGADGDLPWRISDDLKWFKASSMGKPVAMGRKTYDSIGRPLPGRDNIVITRSNEVRAPGAFVVRNIPSALMLARHCAFEAGAEEVCVIGGAEIYAQTLKAADRIYLTRVDAAIDGDVFFPSLDSSEWVETAHGACEKNDRNDYDCKFFILDRRR